MPSELIRLTQPSVRTPNTPKVAKLRSDVAELNDFFAKQTLTPPTIKHLGWVRMFHGYTEGFRWDKGGRLYSQPQGRACYQNLPENEEDARKVTRSQLRINGEAVVEIDLSSSFLTIFYALCDKQLDRDQDAYAGIHSAHRVFASWCGVSFGSLSWASLRTPNSRVYGSRTSAGIPLRANQLPSFARTNATIRNAICMRLLYLARANRSGLSVRCCNHRGFFCSGTVGWARTTDLLFHRQAL
jgi:hypothetical protein